MQSKIESIPESAVAHKKSRTQAEVLEDLVSNVRNMDIRLRDTMDEYPQMNRKFRRGLHPKMMMDISHFVGIRPGDPLQLVISASLLKDDVPWLYELALEAYRGVRSGNISEAKRALEQYRKAVEVLREGPYLDMLGMDSKMAYMMLRDTVEYLPMLEDFEADMPANEPKLSRNRKKSSF